MTELLPSLTTLLLAEPTVATAYVIYGLVGFGSTLVSVPVLAHVLPVSTVVPALAALDLMAASSSGVKLSADLVKAEVKRLAPAMLIGSAFGAWVLFALPVRALMGLLGVFVVLYALNGLRPKPAPAPLHARWAWWFGSIGGVFSALFGAGGWVYAIYLTRRLDDPRQIRATQTAVLTISAFVRVTLFLVAGRFFDLTLLALVVVLLPAMAVGMWLSHRLTLRMNRVQFMRVLYGVLLFTGGSLLLRATFGA